MVKNIQKYNYTDLIIDLKTIIDKLQNNHYDTILAIARGGLGIAQILGESLDIRDVYSVNAISYDKDKKLDDIRIFNIPINLEYSKKVLIVDDISDTGETLYKLDKILKQNFQNILFETFTIFYKPETIFKPTYSIKQTNNWIEFYWNNKLWLNSQH